MVLRLNCKLIEININTPALLFPAITLLMLAYTNRFLSLASLVRKLHSDYGKGEDIQMIVSQLKNLRARLNLIRYMQGFGVMSFLSCVLCMYASVLVAYPSPYKMQPKSQVKLINDSEAISNATYPAAQASRKSVVIIREFEL